MLAMGRLMDRVMGSVNVNDPRTSQAIRAELERIRGVCHWTDGRWEELGLGWNEIQNLPRHIRDLTELLLRAYLTHRKSAA